ncbi:21240_t:CDS:2 [Gigaspora margarita]|uniref:21240_t:CDS:1 n=1 Tax=Gigaspora margarita TaxID=4874 RepID=A0ABM8W5Z1_GIGMA|nr:21240_t:CDS:2 [Gigaspora margarita]
MKRLYKNEQIEETERAERNNVRNDRQNQKTTNTNIEILVVAVQVPEQENPQIENTPTKKV